VHHFALTPSSVSDRNVKIKEVHLLGTNTMGQTLLKSSHWLSGATYVKQDDRNVIVVVYLFWVNLPCQIIICT